MRLFRDRSGHQVVDEVVVTREQAPGEGDDWVVRRFSESPDGVLMTIQHSDLPMGASRASIVASVQGQGIDWSEIVEPVQVRLSRTADFFHGAPPGQVLDVAWL